MAACHLIQVVGLAACRKGAAFSDPVLEQIHEAEHAARYDFIEWFGNRKRADCARSRGYVTEESEDILFNAEWSEELIALRDHRNALNYAMSRQRR